MGRALKPYLYYRQENVEAEKFPAIEFANRIVDAEKFRAANSKNTLHFSSLRSHLVQSNPQYEFFSDGLICI